MKLHKIKKNELGITLVALVVTVVILIILAGVAINLTLGNNGLFARAKIAERKYKYAQAKEDVELVLSDIYIDCVSQEKEYNAEEIYNAILSNNKLNILKVYQEDEQGNTTEKITDVVVSSKTNDEYKFLVGNNGKINGVTDNAISNTTKKTDFIDVEEFKINTIDQTTNNENIENLVEYDANGGTGTVPQTTSHIYNSKVIVDTLTKEQNTLTRENYTFKGWATTKKSDTTIDEFDMPKSNVTLYAQWEIAELSISKVENNTSISVNIECSISDNMQIEYIIRKKRDNSLIENSQKTNQLTYTFSNLNEHTNYEITIIIENNSVIETKTISASTLGYISQVPVLSSNTSEVGTVICDSSNYHNTFSTDYAYRMYNGVINSNWYDSGDFLTKSNNGYVGFEFNEQKNISCVKIYPGVRGVSNVYSPNSYIVEIEKIENGVSDWVPITEQIYVDNVGSTSPTTIEFPEVQTKKIRIYFTSSQEWACITELQILTKD